MSQVMAVDGPRDVTSLASSTAKPAPTPSRKRRRRAPTSGAADDCFACQETHSTCDRRRPYCTQCINLGRTCAGYKTQLTWGMGVASRGKLRGLSLPVAKSKKAIASERQGARNGKDSGSSSNTHTGPKAIKIETDGITPAPQPQPRSFSASSANSPATFDFINASPNGTLQSPVTHMPASQSEWASHPTHVRATATPSVPRQRKGSRRLSLQPLQLPTLMSPVDYGPTPMTANAYGGYGDSRYDNAVAESPMAPSYSRAYPTYLAGKPYHAHKIAPTSIYSGNYGSAHSTESHRTGSMSSSLVSDQSNRDFPEGGIYSEHTSSSSLDSIVGEHNLIGMRGNLYFDPVVKGEIGEYEDDGDNILQVDESLDGGQSHLSLQLAVPSMAVGKTRGLRNLINYYDQVIAPVIVAFDGPTNPYRTHILRLASESEALQHAIAALSASNLRMRRDYEVVASVARREAINDNANETSHAISVRKSSIAHVMLRNSVEQLETSVTLGQQSQRELYHKGESIKALNASLSQLRDHTGANDDTVLATLLVLCLYHICDTGVAKFKTQFAGVKKLMTLRSRRSSSKETKWLITMFKWFDAMTATVNDREGQFEDDVDEPEECEISEWALENLAGCDGRLFKIISRLGRLNILSQGKEVHSERLTPKLKPPRPPLQDFYATTTDQYDGNGWAHYIPDPTFSQGASRRQFEAEWFALRQELLDWQFDPSTIPPSMFGGTTGTSGTDANTLDLIHISESFRYSALLYTERLAYPTYPSASPNFQTLVQHAIHNIRAVKSDVYLLWPLFITGTECVDFEHRDLIRKRCIDIQSDSGFYNNTSTLTLLEKVWAEKDHASTTPYSRDEKPGAHGPFTWRKAMASEEGEYIVI